MKIHAVLAAACSAFVLPACAPTLKRPPSPFPSASKLAELEARPASTPREVEPVSDVDTWTLEGPLPVTISALPYAGTDPWDALLADSLSSNVKLRATEAMHCVARELGRFQLANEGRAAEDLQRFVMARCGSHAPSLLKDGISWKDLEGEIPAEELVTSARPGVETIFARLAAEGESLDVGLWFGREKNRGLVMVVSVPREAELEPVPMAAGAGRVVVKGTLTEAAAHIEARVNRGRFQSADCERDRAIALPSFAFVCETDASDTQAWISVAANPPERILGRTVASLLVSPSGGVLGDTYRRPALTSAGVTTGIDRASVASEEGEPDGRRNADQGRTDLATGFLDAVNEVRSEAGLLSLRAAAGQTQTAGRVAPHFFASAFGLESETIADVVALGMLAGWKVDGTVHDGLLTSAWTGQSTDPRRLVASMLETPGGRSVLLDVDGDVLALGTVVEAEWRFLGAMVTVYRLYEYVAPDKRSRTVLEHIDALRAKRGRPIAAQIKGLSAEAAAAVRAIETDHRDPAQALQGFLQASAAKAKRPVQGYVVETRSLDSFELPEDLADAAFLPVEVAIAYHRPKGEPWGRWVIMIVTVASQPA